MGHEYVADVEKHSSQTDAARGFGGKYGVESDRADKVGGSFLPLPYSLNYVGLTTTTQPKSVGSCFSGERQDSRGHQWLVMARSHVLSLGGFGANAGATC